MTAMVSTAAATPAETSPRADLDRLEVCVTRHGNDPSANTEASEQDGEER